VLKLILRGGMSLIVIGLIIGLAGALALPQKSHYFMTFEANCVSAPKSS